MAKGSRSCDRPINWKTIFISSFSALFALIFFSSVVVLRETTIMIAGNGNTHYIPNQPQATPNLHNDTSPAVVERPTKIADLQQTQQHYNLYTNPYDPIPLSRHLQFVGRDDYLSFSACLSSVDKDNRRRKCRLSKQILFEFQDIIGSGNHGKILSANIEYTPFSATPLSLNLSQINSQLYAIKFSSDNDTCDVLQFEYNVMKQIQSADNMHLYYLTDLHPLIPWMEWQETNRFTRKKERKCILVLKQIENVKTLDGLIRKKYAPSFELDGGLIPFVMHCYHELMTALYRLHLFNFYHIDLNGVNILVWPRHDIVDERICYLIDFGGVFSMDFDAQTKKLFTGKSHNYSPYAYYNLFLYEQRAKTDWNSTKLNYFAAKDNEYRIIVEIFRLFLEYIELERSELFDDDRWAYVEEARDIQKKIEHITPAGIDTSNQTYIQQIWCLRRQQIQNVRRCMSAHQHSTKQNMEFLKLLEILERAVHETKAIDDNACDGITAEFL